MLISIDVGYAFTKAITDGRKAVFPSVWGEVQQGRMDNELAARNGYLQIETSDGAWLVGQGAIEQSIMVARRQDRDWILTPEYLALCLTAITEVTQATGITVNLATGLPIAYFADREKLKERLLKVHTVSRAGRAHNQRIDIVDVLFLPQGLAAVLSEALDKNGRVKPGPISEGTVGLLDVGGHTIGVATFKELREIVKQTTSIEAGLWGPLTEIGKEINSTYPGLNLLGHEVTEAVKKGFVTYKSQPQDISEIVLDVMKPFTRRILAEASKVWGNAARLDVLLVAGGGAEIVGPVLMNEYPQTRIVEKPQFANVRGYLRFARRHWGI